MSCLAKWALVTVALLWSFGPGIEPSVSAAMGDRGKILFSNSRVDFGKVIRGKELSYSFHFKNIGQGPLLIQGVHAACGCTVAAVSSYKTYAPGESASIDVTFKTDNFVGPVTKVITVMTNERPASNHTLTIKANILAEFIADPPVLDFGDVEDYQKIKKSVKVTPVDGFPLEIKSLNYDKEVLDVAFTPQGAHKWQIEVGLKPFKKTGVLKEVILVNNNSQSLPQFKLIVRANLQGPIQFEPGYIELGSIAKEGQSKRLIKLRSKSDFQIKKSWLKLNLNGQEITENQQFYTINSRDLSALEKDVEVSIIHKAKDSGSFHGKLYLETTDSIQKHIVLDFYGFFL